MERVDELEGKEKESGESKRTKRGRGIVRHSLH